MSPRETQRERRLQNLQAKIELQDNLGTKTKNKKSMHLGEFVSKFIKGQIVQQLRMDCKIVLRQKKLIFLLLSFLTFWKYTGCREEERKRERWSLLPHPHHHEQPSRRLLSQTESGRGLPSQQLKGLHANLHDFRGCQKEKPSEREMIRGQHKKSNLPIFPFPSSSLATLKEKTYLT